MKLRIEDLGEPLIEFANGSTGKDPKLVLSKRGPFGSTGQTGNKTVSLGLVCPDTETEPILAWVRMLHNLLLEEETNAQRFREFPGARHALRASFEVANHHIRTFKALKFQTALTLAPHQRFEELLRIYTESISTLLGDGSPDCILVCFPESVANLRITNPRLSAKDQALLQVLQEDTDEEQYRLFEPTPEDRKAAAELLTQADDLLYRNFHRALKARCMLFPNAVPLQVIRRQTYVPTEAKQSSATRAWNLCVALYYKAGNIPWRPYHLSPGTCFVGISFHYLKRRGEDLVYASVAQAFANDLEPFALKGAAIPRAQTRSKQPYMTEEQSSELIDRIIKRYELHTGSPPQRVIVHKTSHYQPEEAAGFGAGLRDRVPAHDLIWIAPTGFRLLRRGMREPLRGTLCTLQDTETYLFTTGYVHWWREYPGPHIPAPLQIGAHNATDLVARARELLLLTKMNWNSADGISRHPISITFARRVGMIMTEIDEDSTPNPLYRFYM